MFALARKIRRPPSQHAAGDWEKKKFMGVEIAGKTLGVVGLGNIGRQAASGGVGLKMNVIGFDPLAAEELPAGVRVRSRSTSSSRSSDFITLHVPLTPETEEAVRRRDLREDEEGRASSTARAAASSTRRRCSRR